MSSDTVQSNGSDDNKETMSADKSSDSIITITPRPAQGAIDLHKPVGMVMNRPIMASEFEVAEMISDAGMRPIGVSHLDIAGTYMNGRPIGASHLAITSTLPGDRPVFESEVKMVPGEIFYGDRPIMLSDPQLMEASTLPGGRPIASNDSDDAGTLMGYLD
jgi:hypothetical protein